MFLDLGFLTSSTFFQDQTQCDPPGPDRPRDRLQGRYWTGTQHLQDSYPPQGYHTVVWVRCNVQHPYYQPRIDTPSGGCCPSLILS